MGKPLYLPNLSNMEWLILECIVNGRCAVKDIERELKLNKNNAKVHVCHIRKKIKEYNFTITNEHRTGVLHLVRIRTNDANE